MLNKERYSSLAFLFVLLPFLAFAQAEVIPRDGLIAEYLFEDTTNLGLDSSGNNRHGVNVGGSSGEGLTGNKAVRFTDNNDYINMSVLTPYLQYGKDFSFSLWAKKIGDGNYGLFSGGQYANSSSNRILELTFYQQYMTIVTLKDYATSGGRQGYVRTTPPVPELNRFYHFVVSYSNNSLAFYVDGELIGTQDMQGYDWSHNFPYALGTRASNNLSVHSSFNGLIDNARFYNRGLTQTEIDQLLAEKVSAPSNQAPIATADSFTLKDTDGVTELDILANDTDENKASLAVTITNQSGVGGSATVSGQKLRYTPQPGYVGEDWIEYRLTDNEGLTSEVVRVTLTLEADPTASCAGDKVARFDGNGDYLTFIAGEDKNYPEFSVSLMSNTDTHNSMPIYIANRDMEGQYFFFYFYSGHFYTSGIPSGAFYPKNGAHKAGQWATYTITYDGTNLIMYVNGNEVNRTTGNYSLANSIRLGSSYSRDYDLSGDIDNVLVYDRALSAAEVSAVVSKTVPTNGLVSHYDFDGDNSLANKATSGQVLAVTGNVVLVTSSGKTCPPSVVNQAPVGIADSFTFKDTDGVTELDILANDTDEDKSTLAITITNQSGAGGSATVSGQKLSYTPLAGYAGEDWVEYQLTDKEGLTSEVVRVTLTLTYPPLRPPAITPTHNWIYAFEGDLTVTIETDEPGASVEYYLLKLVRQGEFQREEVKPYTGPFVIEDNYALVRIFARVKKDGHEPSEYKDHTFVFCRLSPGCSWEGGVKEELRWGSETVKVGQRADLHWNFVRVSTCYEETTDLGKQTHLRNSGENENNDRYNRQHQQRRFTQPGVKKSDWYCNDQLYEDQREIPRSGVYSVSIEVEKLDAPQGVNPVTLENAANNQKVVRLNWSPVDHASYYRIQYKLDGQDWQTLAAHALRKDITLSPGAYSFKVSACIPESCEGVSEETLVNFTVEAQPMLLTSLSWAPKEVVVGQASRLSWNVTNATECSIQGEDTKYQGVGSKGYPGFYQAGVVDKVLVCSNATQTQTFNLVVEEHLRVKKLLAPANLRKDN